MVPQRRCPLQPLPYQPDPRRCRCYVLQHFNPRDAMLARSLRQRRVCPSVRLSVRYTPVLCLAERKQDREMYTI